MMYLTKMDVVFYYDVNFLLKIQWLIFRKHTHKTKQGSYLGMLHCSDKMGALQKLGNPIQVDLYLMQALGGSPL